MNFLIYRYGSICEPDVIESLTELGHAVTSIDIEMQDKQPDLTKVIQVLGDTLTQTHFDAVFSINYYPLLASVCDIFKIRYICLTVDSPIMELYSDTICKQWNRLFLFDLEQYHTFHPMNPDCIFHLPLAVNINRLDSFFSTCKKADLARHASKISFVGSLYTEKCPYDKLPQDNSYLNGYLSGIMEAQIKIYGYYFIPEVLPDEIVDEFVRKIPDFYQPPDMATRDDRVAMALMYLGPKITSMERTRLLNSLGERYSVDIYTNSNTSHLPLHNHGTIKTHTEMPLVFAGSDINLNMTAKSIRSGVPLRVFDVLGCGGFLLSNYQPELADHFTIGEDLDIYTSEEDLLEKVEYYLSHEKERKEIAANGQQKIRQCHTFHQRMAEMIDIAFSF